MTDFAVDDDVDGTLHDDVPRLALISLTKHCNTTTQTVVHNYITLH